MSILNVMIPEDQFASGGRFEGQDPSKVAILLGMSANGKRYDLEVCLNPTSIQDWQFHPQNWYEFQKALDLVENKLIKFTDDTGVEMSISELITVYRTYWMEL